MNKATRKVVALLSIACSGILYGATTELRTPLTLEFGWGPSRYQLDKVDDGNWSFDTFKSYYRRTAKDALGKKKAEDCCDDIKDLSCDTTSCGKLVDTIKTSRDKFPLSQLFFGKSQFRGEEVFANGRQIIDRNPFMSSALITTNFEYQERGMVFGARVERHWDDSKWHVGARATLPFKTIKIEHQVTGIKLEEDLDDMVIRRVEVVDNTNNKDVFAYRLDFLTALKSPVIDPIVNYTSRTIAGENITETTALLNAPNEAPISALRSVNGRFCSIPDNNSDPIAINAAPDDILAGNGSGGSNGSRLVFRSTIDYAALSQDRDAQRQLFIVPNSTGGGDLEAEALRIQQQVEFALKFLGDTGRDSALKFFQEKCIVFTEDECIAGIGDLDTEFYVGCDFREDLYGNVLFGLRLPTGKKADDPRRALVQPLGNNGHVEFKIGTEWGYRPWDWCAIHADLNYSHVAKSKENRAAPFKCSTIRNIGPSVCADISWNYFTGHLDITTYHPENPNLGCSFGYELYHKSRDHVTLVACDSVRDLLGNKQEVDAALLERDTKITSHKLRGSIFHRWEYCELFAGASRVVAGKNVMKESEIHLGFGIYF